MLVLVNLSIWKVAVRLVVLGVDSMWPNRLLRWRISTRNGAGKASAVQLMVIKVFWMMRCEEGHGSFQRIISVGEDALKEGSMQFQIYGNLRKFEFWDINQDKLHPAKIMIFIGYLYIPYRMRSISLEIFLRKLSKMHWILPASLSWACKMWITTLICVSLLVLKTTRSLAFCSKL